MSRAAGRVAAIDIGTNTLLLLVAEPRGGELAAVHEEIRFGRLGQGLDRSRRLGEEAIARSLEALREYRAAIDRLGAARVGAVGTQALREADNAAAFLEPARAILGVPVEVISGRREAELVFGAVARSFPALAGGDLVVVDVGGGSTEIVAGAGGEVRSWCSLPLGSVRLAERHLQSDPPRPEEARELCAAIDAALAGLDLPAGAPVVATAGTATTLATVELRLAAWDPARVQGLRLGRAVIERQLARYLELTVEERKALPGLEPQRADVIPAGAAILVRLMARLDAPELIVSDRGVRWGLAFELASGAQRAM